jgi:transmembrane sensor
MVTADPRSASISPELKAEAAAWVARLHGSGRTSALQAALRAWIAADPSHARALELATEAWEIGGSIPATAVPRISPVRWRTLRIGLAKPALGVATVLVLVGAAAIFALRDRPISTETGEQRSVTLDDGTRVSLNTNTRLSVHYTKSERQIRLETGEAFFDVAKNPHRPFVVLAGNQSVIALGTSFMVRRDEGVVDVTLVEGKVTVTTEDVSDTLVTPPANGQVLAPGERLRIAGARPTLDRPSIDALTAWRRGEVVLDHTRLADAVDEMNRYSREKLIISAPGSGDILVSGIFRAGDSARFARAIADTYHLRIMEEPSRIVLADMPAAKPP